MERLKFQKILKELMQSAGISQKQLALSTGIPVSSIASWYGKQSSLPNIDYVAKLAHFFGCSIDYLAGFELEDGRKLYDQKIVEKKSEVQSVFSKRLRGMRKSLGLTQVELAELAGIRQSNISAWELGTRTPLPDGLSALARALGCSIDYLVGLEEEGCKFYDNQPVKSKKGEIQAIYDKLDGIRQHMALKYVKRLRDIELD